MNEDQKDTKTKNAFNEKQEIEKKGSYKHRRFKKASEVKYQPGLQVNIPLGGRRARKVSLKFLATHSKRQRTLQAHATKEVFE